MKKILLLIAFTPMLSWSQVDKTSELYQQMKQLDSIVFDVGFNQCNLQPTEALLTEDFEFYHDLGGIQDKEAFLTAMKNNICGNSDLNITRQLIEGSMEVFPLTSNNKLYGALQRGEHEFFQQPKGEGNTKTGYARFTSYWELQDGVWKLRRTFSFDHKAAD